MTKYMPKLVLGTHSDQGFGNWSLRI